MKTRLAFVMVLALGSIPMFATFGTAGAPVVVVATDKAELGPTASESYVAWFTPGHGARSNVWAEALGDGEPFRVNPAGTSAFTGGVDGSMLVFEQREIGGKPDLVLVDLATRTTVDLPEGVNTPRGEYAPSMSDDLLLFGRGIRRGASVVLFDTSTGTSSTIYSKRNTERRFFNVLPIQVNGGYAVWEQLVHDRRGNLVGLGVWRYDVTSGTRLRIPSGPDEWLYGPSVSQDGTVYVGRSGFSCGERTELVSYALDGTVTVIYDFPPATDFGFSWTVDHSDGTKDIYFDRGSCDGSNPGDIVKLEGVVSPT